MEARERERMCVCVKELMVKFEGARPFAHRISLIRRVRGYSIWINDIKRERERVKTPLLYKIVHMMINTQSDTLCEVYELKIQLNHLGFASIFIFKGVLIDFINVCFISLFVVVVVFLLSLFLARSFVHAIKCVHPILDYFTFFFKKEFAMMWMEFYESKSER